MKQGSPALARILLMEDDAEQAALLCEILCRAGHEVAVTYRASDAYAEYQIRQFDLLITDLYVPRTTAGATDGGIALIGRIRAAELRQGAALPHLQILAVSGTGGGPVSRQHFLITARSLGADQTLSKPFEIPAFLKTVEEMVASGTRPQPAGTQSA